ncbi:olfactomedin-like [Tiliqua scincoides]|uniref:olfactomedin-like n=1 Tax=Tiliqua scincoides TaxID=71010 RepID=UPI003462C217
MEYMTTDPSDPGTIHVNGIDLPHAERFWYLGSMIVADSSLSHETTMQVCKCDHDGLDGISGPILVKLNWKGLNFKTGAWGKDFALGTKLSEHYWVFPANQGSHILETFRLYSSYRKLLLYFAVLEFSLKGKDDKCENCAQGGGVVFYNGSFYYNCYDSRALCKTDPHTMRLLRKELEDDDPSSFNNLYSYKGVKYQDMDFAGDEKGLWMIHGSSKGNGLMVVRKVDPDTLNVQQPWTTTQQKTNVTNSFMICGVLYATQRVNATHEKIFYAFDINKTQDQKKDIYMEKLLPTMQSLNYNPNDQKLYMYNDGYLIYYNLTFKNPGSRTKSRAGYLAATEQGQNFDSEGGQSLVSKGAQDTVSQEDHSSSASNQQQHLTSKRDISSHHEEGQTAGRKGRQDTMWMGGQVMTREKDYILDDTEEKAGEGKQ